MPEMKMNFKNNGVSRRAAFAHKATFDSPPVDQFKRR
jgi:hypothetical protein